MRLSASTLASTFSPSCIFAEKDGSMTNPKLTICSLHDHYYISFRAIRPRWLELLLQTGIFFSGNKLSWRELFRGPLDTTGTAKVTAKKRGGELGRARNPFETLFWGDCRTQSLVSPVVDSFGIPCFRYSCVFRLDGVGWRRFRRKRSVSKIGAAGAKRRSIYAPAAVELLSSPSGAPRVEESSLGIA